MESPLSRRRRMRKEAKAFEALYRNFDIELRDRDGLFVVWVKGGSGLQNRCFAVLTEEEYGKIREALDILERR